MGIQGNFYVQDFSGHPVTVTAYICVTPGKPMANRWGTGTLSSYAVYAVNNENYPINFSLFLSYQEFTIKSGEFSYILVVSRGAEELYASPPMPFGLCIGCFG